MRPGVKVHWRENLLDGELRYRVATIPMQPLSIGGREPGATINDSLAQVACATMTHGGCLPEPTMVREQNG